MMSDVEYVMNDKLSYDARKENPNFSTKLEGKGGFDYYVQFYECADSGYNGNLYFRDDRYFPLLFKDRELYGINWDDYENLIGASFVMSHSRKAGKREGSGFDESDSLLLGIGTGFLIDNKGYIVTNYHVVENIKTISVYSPVLNKKFVVIGVVKDIANDLAILKIVDSTYSTDTFRKINYRITEQDEIKMGQEVFTLGFPLTTYLGTTSRLSNGLISSKLGFEDDPRTYQISNPLQPGNSGGPLFNMKGNLVGIVVATLSAPSILFQTGILSQNINFAVKVDYLKALLEYSNIEEPKSDFDPVDDVNMENLIERLNEFIVMVICEDETFIRSQKK